MPRRPAEPLLTVRAALILGLALIVGGTAGALAVWAGGALPEALLTAGAAAAGTISLLHQIIGNDTDR
ncbi:hypothetical protein EDD29_4510 [Actinocorallia herbida]|uniref:Uncharacterized protein n=2 Tax=Actinocorallia herbida TaxID=58109 RepID=A0A3N1D093_9ACTN|nr:hypothetical protein EDD29_4510 [Actinocorallia herbida]